MKKTRDRTDLPESWMCRFPIQMDTATPADFWGFERTVAFVSD
jgi:hypothetical protein